MTKLVFPQLKSGALAQYPIRKTQTIRTIKNLMADGSMLVAADPGSSHITWELSYIELALSDVNALQSHFQACNGALRGFTFLDPTENLLLYSADFRASVWMIPTGMQVEGGFPDPFGGTTAFKVTNSETAPLAITQSLDAPAGFQYCFSLYASSSSNASCGLTRTSANASDVQAVSLNSQWTRIESSGKLTDVGTGLVVGVSLAAGQSGLFFGPQLEPQFTPSRFRPTYASAGLYSNSHWAASELVFKADAPDLYSTSFAVEARLLS